MANKFIDIDLAENDAKINKLFDMLPFVRKNRTNKTSYYCNAYHEIEEEIEALLDHRDRLIRNM